MEGGLGGQRMGTIEGIPRTEVEGERKSIPTSIGKNGKGASWGTKN